MIRRVNVLIVGAAEPFETTVPVPEAAVTVLCTPDDGCDGHPKHVEWFCSK